MEDTLVWFRQDLRLSDNPALVSACEKGKILPLFIWDSTCPEQFVPGGASKWWLHHSLISLNEQLEHKLLCLKGDPVSLLLDLIKQSGIKRVVWNRCYEPWQIKRDTQIKQTLNENGIEVHSFNGNLLWEPWQITKQDGSPYKVFTPYYKRGCLNAPAPRIPLPTPNIELMQDVQLMSDQIKHLGLLPEFNWYEEMKQNWLPGEQGAKQQLSKFLSTPVTHYKKERDIPSVQGTSLLSPHLHFGEISPNQIWYAAVDALQGNVDHPDLNCFLSELGWREFSYYLLYHFPDIPEKNFNPLYNHFRWLTDEPSLEAWKRGQTGIPIIDAGMRQLWRTGYMHNRVRMIVGSFLVKNLLIDWRHGERWFWDCLLDADLASNSASWQWVAGTGADAAPYFRIFNPVLQGEKFDPQGAYVKHYCPELADMPDKYIHQPWNAPEMVLREAGLTLGKEYPKPIVDLKASRQRALDTLASCKTSI